MSGEQLSDALKKALSEAYDNGRHDVIDSVIETFQEYPLGPFTAAQITAILSEIKNKLGAGRTDQQIIDHPDFEQHIRRMLRTNSPEFGAWMLRQSRINGSRWPIHGR